MHGDMDKIYRPVNMGVTKKKFVLFFNQRTIGLISLLCVLIIVVLQCPLPPLSQNSRVLDTMLVYLQTTLVPVNYMKEEVLKLSSRRSIQMRLWS